MRLPISTDLKTRTGAPSGKDARLVNSYVEVKGEQSVVRKRAIAQGGVSVGSGTAQGMIGFSIAGVDKLIGVWGDTLTNYTGGGTTWNSGTSYLIGDHVSYGFVDYWALNDNTGSQPPSADWSQDFIPAVPVIGYATWNPLDIAPDLVLSGGNLIVSDPSDSAGSVRATVGKSSGKWYWEITNIDNSILVGVGNTSASLLLAVGSDINGWSYRQDTTGLRYKLHNAIQDNTYGTDGSSNCTIGVLLNMDDGELSFTLNGASLGLAYTGLSGVLYPMVYISYKDVGTLCTANFGASAFSYSVPSGYNSGLYT